MAIRTDRHHLTPERLLQDAGMSRECLKSWLHGSQVCPSRHITEVAGQQRLLWCRELSNWSHTNTDSFLPREKRKGGKRERAIVKEGRRYDNVPLVFEREKLNRKKRTDCRSGSSSCTTTKRNPLLHLLR